MIDVNEPMSQQENLLNRVVELSEKEFFGHGRFAVDWMGVFDSFHRFLKRAAMDGSNGQTDDSQTGSGIIGSIITKTLDLPAWESMHIEFLNERAQSFIQHFAQVKSDAYFYLPPKWSDYYDKFELNSNYDVKDNTESQNCQSAFEVIEDTLLSSPSSSIGTDLQLRHRNIKQRVLSCPSVLQCYRPTTNSRMKTVLNGAIMAGEPMEFIEWLVCMGAVQSNEDSDYTVLEVAAKHAKNHVILYYLLTILEDDSTCRDHARKNISSFCCDE